MRDGCVERRGDEAGDVRGLTREICNKMQKMSLNLVGRDEIEENPKLRNGAGQMSDPKDEFIQTLDSTGILQRGISQRPIQFNQRLVQQIEFTILGFNKLRAQTADYATVLETS